MKRAAASQKGVHILVVEDSPTQAEGLKHLLQEFRYRVTVARNGRLALEAARRDHPTLVISDIVMPEMDGFSLCKRLKSEDRLKDVPVILMTSLSAPEDVMKGLEAGADNFIRKPFDDRYLISRIEYILSNRKLRASSKVGVEMEIVLAGQKHRITSERQQILDLLISTYEEAVHLNAQLQQQQEQLAALAADLERKVQERTAALVAEVAERTRAEAEFRVLLEAAPAAIVQVDGEGRIMLVNAQTEQMFGYERHELLGQPVELLVPDRFRETHIRQRRDYLTAPAPRLTRTDLNLHGRRKNGEEFPAEITLSPIVREGGIWVTAVIRDVSERQRAEQTMRRLALIVESSDDAIISTDLGGRILSWNEAATRIFGYTHAEAHDRNASVLAPEEEKPWFSEGLKRAGRGEGLKISDAIAMTKSGSRIEVSVTMSPIRDAAGIVAGVSAIVRDISERRRLEEQLRQSQKMEAIGSLAGGIAHDFNNLLGVILGAGELALLRLQDDDAVRKYVLQMRRAAERAASLTRQLLAFSRRQSLEPRVLDLNVILREMEKMLRRLIGENIDLETTFEPNLSRTMADPGQIEQVIMNLVVNARDAMPRGGKLTITTANVELDEEYARQHAEVEPGAYVRLTVSDTGMGMPPEVRARIFEPFFTTKEEGKGTGLGLSTVYGIIKQSGGHIWVYSEVGKGTTFKVYLPCIFTETVAERPMNAAANAGHGTETILLVEDADDLRELAAEFLEGSGYKVLSAATGAEALDIAERYSGLIHVLVTDVIMPGMSGAELATQLVQRRPTLKVIYASGYTAGEIGHHGVLDAGLVLVEKPYTRVGLTRKIREVLDGDGY